MFLFKHVQVECVTLLYHSNKDIKTFILTYYVVVILTIFLVFRASFPDSCVLQCENILCYVCSLKSFGNKGIRGILFLMWCCCLSFGLFSCVLYCSIYIHLFDISYKMYHGHFSLSYVFRYMFEYTVLMLQKKLFVYEIHFCFCSFDIESIGRIMFLCLYCLMIHGL